MPVTRIFYAYRDSPERRRALAARAGRGRALPPVRARRASRARPRRSPQPRARLVAGLGASFRRPGEERPRASRRVRRRLRDRARVAARGEPRGRRLSTVDTVGIPLLLAARVRGCCGRRSCTSPSGSPSASRSFARSACGGCTPVRFRACAAILAYSAREADGHRRAGSRSGAAACRCRSCRSASTPTRCDPRDVPRAHDVVSVGADPHRDFELLARGRADAPRRRASPSSRPATRARALADVPANVAVEVDLPFERMRERLEGARVVALPVRENTYSGATTVLLQAMALEKPVVVSRTSAIATGYGLVDGENCRLVEPGDAACFAKSVRDVLGDELHARALGAGARRTVERELTWAQYVDRDRADRSLGCRGCRSSAVVRLTAGLSCARAVRWIASARRARSIGFAARPLSRRADAATATRASSSASPRGCSTAISSTADVIDNKDPLFFYTYAAALWVGGWRGAVPRSTASGSRSRPSPIGLLLDRELRRPRAGRRRRLLRRIPLALVAGWYLAGADDARRARASRRSSPWLWLRGSFGWSGVVARGRAALQAQHRARRRRSARRARRRSEARTGRDCAQARCAAFGGFVATSRGSRRVSSRFAASCAAILETLDYNFHYPRPPSRFEGNRPGGVASASRRRAPSSSSRRAAGSSRCASRRSCALAAASRSAWWRGGRPLALCWPGSRAATLVRPPSSRSRSPRIWIHHLQMLALSCRARRRACSRVRGDVARREGRCARGCRVRAVRALDAAQERAASLAPYAAWQGPPRSAPARSCSRTRVLASIPRRRDHVRGVRKQQRERARGVHRRRVRSRLPLVPPLSAQRRPSTSPRRSRAPSDEAPMLVAGHARLLRASADAFPEWDAFVRDVRAAPRRALRARRRASTRLPGVAQDSRA